MSWPQVLFPNGFDDLYASEIEMKGWVGPVEVMTESGALYQLYFYDPVRLEQELKYWKDRGAPCFTEPGLVIISEVTIENIRTAVSHLWNDGFFSYLKPIDAK